MGRHTKLLKNENISKANKTLLKEGWNDGRKVWAQLCAWDNSAGDGSIPSSGFYHSKMTINGNKPEVGDTFRNKESEGGNPTGSSYGIENAVYKVTDTGNWTMGTTYNFPADSNCGGHVGVQWVCLFEWGGNDPYTSNDPTPSGGHYNVCKEMIHESLNWQLNDPNSTGQGNFPPIGTWYVFHDTIQECEDYCIGTFDCQLTSGTPQGGPNTPPQGGCFQTYPWEINNGYYPTIQDCEEGCPYVNASGTSGKYKCADTNCDPLSMACLKECTECDYYEVLAGNCPYDSVQECKDSDCEIVEAYRCHDCNTPCTQNQINAGVCPYVQQVNGANDAKAECAAACASTDKYRCANPDKFGNPRCAECKEFELSDPSVECFNTKQECVDSDCPGTKVKDPKKFKDDVFSYLGPGKKKSGNGVIDVEVDAEFTEDPTKELKESIKRIKKQLKNFK
jgi:hypothetical protein|tara:strand:+ start:1550 stop:2899 length:1350 start_codon:yes stop_codon:yes gene_type:complete